MEDVEDDVRDFARVDRRRSTCRLYLQADRANILQALDEHRGLEGREARTQQLHHVRGWHAATAQGAQVGGVFTTIFKTILNRLHSTPSSAPYFLNGR